MAADHPDSGPDVGEAAAKLEAELVTERVDSTSSHERRPGSGEAVDEGARIAAIEARLHEQSRRLEALGEGRERSLAELRRLRQELELVARERDELAEELKRVDGMQSETIAFDDPRAAGDAETGPDAEPPVRDAAETPGLPTIEELIALNAEETPPPAAPQAGQPLVGQMVSESDTGWHELLPADLIVAQGPGEAPQRRFAEAGRWQLVRTDVDPPEPFTLDEPLMTIGRSPSADIQIDAGYISRIHARLLQIDASFILEDAGSKNGIHINGERVERWPLRHGDVIQIGAVPFRFVDIDRESGT